MPVNYSSPTDPDTETTYCTWLVKWRSKFESYIASEKENGYMKVEDRKSPLISGAELLGMKFDPEIWIVDGLLRIDSKRMSMLLGQPRDGKSTLAWQLAAAVTSGQPFLGRKTLRSSVLYWQTEAESRKVAASLRRLGYDPARDEKLLVLNSSTTGSNLKA